MKNFWDKVSKTETCWIWIGGGNGRDVNGVDYGLFKIPKTRKNMTAHRMSYALAYGKVPDGKFVLHKCDNPRCVNPDHLFLGSAQDNVDDMIAKGRQVIPDRSGEKNGRARLTVAIVNEIRKQGMKAKEVMLRYGIGRTQAYRIVNNEQWSLA